jgi:hypothetical protein
VGIEAPDDLIADLAQAFDLASHPHVVNVRSVRRKDTADEAELGLPTANGTDSSTPMVSDSSAHLEDAVSVARAECVRLQGINRVLRERLAEVEASSAELEASRRANGGGPIVQKTSQTAPSTNATTLLALSLAGASLAIAVANYVLRRRS